MFNKINRKLVVTYPLLWNTRVLSILGTMLVFHLLFFLFGFASVNDIRYLVVNSNHDRILNDFGIGMFAVLLVSIVIIIWLLFYLRNNPFKSFYPVNKTYLVKEFFLVWLIFFFTITVFHSYIYGRHVHLLSLTKGCNPEKEALLLNQANCFLPLHKNNFSKHNSCDSIKARVEINAKRRIPSPDSCNNYIPVVPERYYGEEIPGGEGRVDTYSYLYYCEEPLFLGTANSSKYDYHAVAKRWLLNRRTDSIRNCLSEYAKLMDRYHLKYNFDIDTVTSWCFADSLHSVSSTLTNAYPSQHNGFDFVSPNNGEFNRLEEALEKVDREREKNFFNITKWLAFFYVSLSLSIVLFMFRITRLKPWFASIIGVGIWSILLAIAGQAGKENITIFIIFLIVLFLLMACVFIGGKKIKLVSALWLNWFAFGFLLVIPLTFNLVEKNTREIRECIHEVWVVTRPEHPINAWINSNWDTINFLNIAGAACIMVFVIIPLAYRWQANPSE